MTSHDVMSSHQYRIASVTVKSCKSWPMVAVAIRPPRRRSRRDRSIGRLQAPPYGRDHVPLDSLSALYVHSRVANGKALRTALERLRYSGDALAIARPTRSHRRGAAALLLGTPDQARARASPRRQNRSRARARQTPLLFGNSILDYPSSLTVGTRLLGLTCRTSCGCILGTASGSSARSSSRLPPKG